MEKNPNKFLLKYANNKIHKNKYNLNKLTEYKRMKKIATYNLYNNNVLRKKSLLDILFKI